MDLTGVHLLLSYQCTYECDHCFVFGSPRQNGTMTLAQIHRILDQSDDLGTVEWIYFEGGEPFLFHPVLVKAVLESKRRGYKVGVVSNAYWATSEEDAMAWLQPLAGSVDDLTLSSDLYHASEEKSRQAEAARLAAERLGLQAGVICIAQPDAADSAAVVGKLPEGQSGVRYRGRAAVELAKRARTAPADSYTDCPYEDLRQPGRVHVDPLGHVHLCQGISIGNVFETSLREICSGFDPEAHPVTGPLLEGGPAALARRHGLPVAGEFADACHFCFSTRVALRDRLKEVLVPDQMYGVGDP